MVDRGGLFLLLFARARLRVLDGADQEPPSRYRLHLHLSTLLTSPPSLPSFNTSISTKNEDVGSLTVPLHPETAWIGLLILQRLSSNIRVHLKWKLEEFVRRTFSVSSLFSTIILSRCVGTSRARADSIRLKIDSFVPTDFRLFAKKTRFFEIKKLAYRCRNRRIGRVIIVDADGEIEVWLERNWRSQERRSGEMISKNVNSEVCSCEFTFSLSISIIPVWEVPTDAFRIQTEIYDPRTSSRKSFSFWRVG
jgi:hypothetical protein